MKPKQAYTLIATGSIAGAFFAERYRDQFYSNHVFQEGVDADNENRLPLGDVRRRVLLHFQREVLNLFADNILETTEPTDDLLNDEDPSVVDIYKVYKEFTTKNPWFDVYSMIPMDMIGTFGFVVCRNDM